MDRNSIFTTGTNRYWSSNLLLCFRGNPLFLNSLRKELRNNRYNGVMSYTHSAYESLTMIELKKWNEKNSYLNITVTFCNSDIGTPDLGASMRSEPGICEPLKWSQFSGASQHEHLTTLHVNPAFKHECFYTPKLLHRMMHVRNYDLCQYCRKS